MKIVLCVLVGIVGFFIIPAVWMGWQQSMGFTTPGSLFILLIWGATAAALRAIWKYQPNDK